MNKKRSFGEKIADHSLSIISLVIAITALTYNTWRANTSEENRNIRVASFEMIRELGELQNITNQLHFSQTSNSNNKEQLLITGWGHIAVIEDLSILLPKPILKKVTLLKSQWQNQHNQLGKNNNAEKNISQAIYDIREQTRLLLVKLK